MSADNAKWLEKWRASYIYSEERVPSDTDVLIADCIDDAEHEGITREKLNEAAGGDLRQYIVDAIMRHSRKAS